MDERRVGPFLLRQLVSKSSDGTLWLGERVHTSRPPRWAAVRVADDPRGPAADRIAHEYRVLRELDDPRLPRVLGHFPGLGALAVAWVPGAGLDLALLAHRGGRLTLQAATVLDIGLELHQALRHVHGRKDEHGRPLFHGRIAARHLRLSRDGGLVLLGMGRRHADFGLAANAPEVLDKGPLGPALDQWCLGALLVELLGGVPLYQGASAADRLEGRVQPQVEPIARVNPEVGRLLTRLLAQDPAARFPDDGELARALAHAGRTLPTPADRAGLGEVLAELDPAAVVPDPEPERLADWQGGVPDPAVPELQTPSARPASTTAATTAAASTAAHSAASAAQADAAPLPSPVAPSDSPHVTDEPTEPLGPGHDVPLVSDDPPRLTGPGQLGAFEIAALVSLGLLLAAGLAWLVGRVA